jgi:beta-lactamase class A
MYNVPVLWAQDNQMTAEYIEIETENQQPKQMNLLNKGFIASQEDSTGFNQVRGKKIIGRFRKGNELYRISVYEDGESVYYTKDGDFLTGVNKAAGPDIVIELEEKKVQQITYIGATVAELIPVNEFDPTELTLLGFNWLEKHKPQNKNEIFHWGERKIENDTTLSISVAQNETIDSLRCKIELLISGKQAHIGVAVMGSKDKDTLTVNNGAHYPTMSVYKYHIALAVLRMVDFGRLRLDQKIRIAKEDLHPDMYSPLRDDYPKGNMDLTLSELMAYMVSKSDNNACDILLRLMNGPKRVDQLVKSMGLTDVSIAVTEREMHEDSTLINQNWTSPFAMVQALEIQRREDVLSANSRNVLWKLLTETTIGNEKIRGKLPPTTVVGHKTGSSYRDAEGIKLVDNDAAIILLPENQYFIVSIFITDSKEDDRTDAAIMADIARLTWNFYTRNK